MIMVSEPDKLILNSIASAKGISIEEVKEDLKTNKVRLTKQNIKKSSDTTVEIVSDGLAKMVDFNQIKGHLKRTEPRENVLEWELQDVAMYIRSKYAKKYKKDWGHRITGVCIELKRIYDRIIDIYGHCDVLVMKDYIDYIFYTYIDRMIDKSGGVFYIRNFREDKYICSFSEKYNYKRSFEKVTNAIKNDKESIENIPMDNKKIEEYFILSEEEFVFTYGVIVCIFWLINCKGYSNKDATSRILEICKKIHKKGEFKLVKERTELLSPYHSSIKFPKMCEFVENIDGRFRIDVDYSDIDIVKNKFKFLLKENK